jgi:hypothetical protein
VALDIGLNPRAKMIRTFSNSNTPVKYRNEVPGCMVGRQDITAGHVDAEGHHADRDRPPRCAGQGSLACLIKTRRGLRKRMSDAMTDDGVLPETLVILVEE